MVIGVGGEGKQRSKFRSNDSEESGREKELVQHTSFDFVERVVQGVAARVQVLLLLRIEAEVSHSKVAEVTPSVRVVGVDAVVKTEREGMAKSTAISVTNEYLLIPS